MSKDGPSFAALPSLQELEWSSMRQRNWPETVCGAAVDTNQTQAALLPPQSAGEQARASAAAKLAASVLSNAPVALPAAAKPSDPAAAVAEERIAEWFAQWTHAGRMGLYGAVPEPFRAFYPLPSEDQPVELDPDVEAILKHYVAWAEAKKK